MRGDPGSLESGVYGSENVSDSMVIDSLSRACAALTNAVVYVAEQVDALRAAVEARENPADPG